MQSKNNLNPKMNSLYMIVVVFISSLSFYNCSTSSKNQELAMSHSIPNRGIAADSRFPFSVTCPKGFKECSKHCSPLGAYCCPSEYVGRRIEDPATGRLTSDCSVLPGYVPCHGVCCKLPKSFCTTGSHDVHISDYSCSLRPNDYEYPTHSIQYRSDGKKFICNENGNFQIAESLCPKGQVLCGGNSCCRGPSDGDDGQGASQ